MFVAIMGYGVVGSGVAAVLKQNHDRIMKSVDGGLDVKYILDLRSFPGDPFESVIINDFNKILEDDEVKIVVETMGGLHPAYEFVSACLKAGKSVATSNKELVAMKGCELLKLAGENNVNFMFEASTGGGIPVLRPIAQCLASNEISEVAGILNGTTNYILTKMITEGVSFDDALKTAQQLGYAEKDPTADVEGLDACRKVCILAALCYGKHVYPDSVHTQGIRGITSEDVEFAKSWGGVIKLIGSSTKLPDGRINACVSPALIKNGSQLASVSDVFNAVLVRGNAVGDVVFYGRGAGKMPTASAVVADVIDCAQHVGDRKPLGWDDAEDGYVIDYNDFTSRFYIRTTADKVKIDTVFGKVDYIPSTCAVKDETAFITEVMSYGKVTEKAEALGDIKSIIRVTDY